MLAIKEYILATSPIENHLKKTRLHPSFFLLGFQKCGTTSVYRYIASQPGFAPGKQKEVDTMTDGTYSLGKFLSYFPNKTAGTFTGNASHMMSYVPGGIKHLKRDFPEAKFLAVVRNPIDRAFSQYNYYKASAQDPKRRTMRIPESFELAVESEIELLSTIDDFHDLEHIYALTSGMNGYGMPICRGLYYYYLNDFQKQGLDVLTVSIEELKSDFQTTLSSLLTHIGIPKDQHLIPEQKRFNSGTSDLEMLASSRNSLRDFFEPHNKKLFDFLGRDLGWD